MAEGGMKAWEPHQVQNPLAFSDEEEEDLLDFMYKYKTLRKTEIPLEVHSVWAGGACVCKGVARETWVSWKRLLGHPALPERLGREDLPPFDRRLALGSIQLFAKGQERP